MMPHDPNPATGWRRDRSGAWWLLAAALWSLSALTGRLWLRGAMWLDRCAVWLEDYAEDQERNAHVEVEVVATYDPQARPARVTTAGSPQAQVASETMRSGDRTLSPDRSPQSDTPLSQQGTDHG